MAEPHEHDHDRDHDRAGTEHPGDELVDLVLGTAEGARRAELVTHVLECASCRAELDQLTAGVTDLLALTPEVQPPPGFDERARVRMARPDRRPRHGFGRAATLVALTAALLALVVAGVVVELRSTDGDVGDGQLTELTLAEGGGTVGSVSVTEIDGRPSMVVAIFDAPADVSYLCRTTLADGTVVDVPPWPPGDGAWIVPVPDDAPIDTVELIEVDSGAVWSSADLTD